MNENLKSRVRAFLNLSKEEVKTEDVVKLAEEKLEDGTILAADSFKEGQAVFIKSPDSETPDTPLPVNEYVLENGDVLVVEEEGIIASVSAPKEAPAEEEAPEEEVEEAAEEAPENAEETEVEEEVEEELLVEMARKIAELDARIAELEGSKEPEEEASSEELSEDTVEETELSAVEVAEEEVKFSPEAEASTKKKEYKAPKNNGIFNDTFEAVRKHLNR